MHSYRRILTVAVVIFFGSVSTVTSFTANAVTQMKKTEESGAVNFITRGVEQYITSIDNADTNLGAKLFNPSASTTFIHPRGHERGWEQIAANFYMKTMGETFTKRTLQRVGNLDIQMYGNSAVVEFDWDFVAIRRDNGQELHTQGRESQTWANFPDKGWRIVQVHYSGPAVTGAGQGF